MENTVKPIYTNIVPKNYQLTVEDARSLRLIDLFTDTDSCGYKHLSRSDLIIIYALYENGLNDFFKDYKKYVEECVSKKNYKVVQKPHYFLKNLIG